MNVRIVSVIAAGSFALGLVPAQAAAPAAGKASAAPALPAAPIRHLVYSFSFSSKGNLEVHDSMSAPTVGAGNPNMGSASDTGALTQGGGFRQTYEANLSDKGTITVDVLKEYPDSGLLVSVSEQGIETRRAAPAICAVYGDSVTLACEPQKTVNSEEMTLLRFLGTNFVNPSRVDAKQHWSVDVDNPTTWTVANFTIEANDRGRMTIDESRVVKGLNGPPVTTDITSKIDYDANRLLPMRVREFAIVHEHRAGGSLMTTTIQTTLDLETDSIH